MKVGIITLHHVRNYGSLLQTFATQNVLRKLDYDTEVIDFVPKGLKLSTGIKTIKSTGNVINDLLRKLGATMAFSKAQFITTRFLKRWIKVSAKRYNSYYELLTCPPDADIFLSGSDQIWNTQNANDPDDIKAYFLNFVTNTKKIAYGSSIGKDKFDTEAEKQNVRKYLEDYSAIGVRESQAVNLLASIGIDNAVHVLDPTLLMDVNQWKRAFDLSMNRKPYVFVYNLNRNPLIKQYASNLAENKKLEIVNFADMLDFIKGAKNRILNSPKDFLRFIYNAEYVVTDSFHGTAFCINFSKQFVTFGAPRFNSRIHSLLKIFSLEERFIFQKPDDCSLITKGIDYNEVHNKLEEERRKSMFFLKTSLKA